MKNMIFTTNVVTKILFFMQIYQMDKKIFEL